MYRCRSKGRFACELVQHLSRLADRVRLFVDFAIITTALVFVHDDEDLEHLALAFIGMCSSPSTPFALEFLHFVVCATN